MMIFKIVIIYIFIIIFLFFIIKIFYKEGYTNNLLTVNLTVTPKTGITIKKIKSVQIKNISVLSDINPPDEVLVIYAKVKKTNMIESINQIYEDANYKQNDNNIFIPTDNDYNIISKNLMEMIDINTVSINITMAKYKTGFPASKHSAIDDFSISIDVIHEPEFIPGYNYNLMRHI